MKGYIYPMFAGADPGMGWRLTDPIYGAVPTLGACVPNIRRAVVPGDFIFTISGRHPGVQQYVVGGFEVREKIHALAALARFPGNEQRELPDGTLAGNIIVRSDGSQSEVDYHSGFNQRIENYVVGKRPIVLDKPAEIERGRHETLETLAAIFRVKGATRLSEITARWRKLDEGQIGALLDWLTSIKSANKRPR